MLDPDVVLGFAPFDADAIASMRACGVTRIVPDPEDGAKLGDLPVLTVGPSRQVEHLHGRGHRRLAFAAALDPRLSDLVGVRLRAARDAAARLDLGPLDVRQVDYRDDSADRAVRHWRADGVTGVIAYNDDIAAAVLGAAIRAGIMVPGEFAVIGHDDSPLATMFVPSISSVRTDAIRLGRYLTDVVLRALGERPQPRFDDLVVSVVVRESTG